MFDLLSVKFCSCEPTKVVNLDIKVIQKRKLTCLGSMMMILIKVRTPSLERTMSTCQQKVYYTNEKSM
jgi:hypothetical protein